MLNCLHIESSNRFNLQGAEAAVFLLLGMLCQAAPAYAFTPSDGTILLGRPTATSISINVVGSTTDVEPKETVELYFEYGTDAALSSPFTTQSLTMTTAPVTVTLSDLLPDTRYFYRMGYRTQEADAGAWDFTAVNGFHTQRAPGQTFTFTVQADSHFGSPGLKEAPDVELYTHTMELAQADDPDFLIDLGDTFMITLESGVQQFLTEYPKVYGKYLTHRRYSGIVGESAPIFLVIGNHENEEGWNRDDKSNPYITYPLMSQNARKRYYLNPVPDDFYSGIQVTHPNIDGDHLRDTVYAFEWGDALFVSIDPYWFTMTQPYRRNYGQEVDDEGAPSQTKWSPDMGWYWTLGDAQYQWLKEVLRNSDAKYKFVFSHQLVGGSAEADGNSIASGYGRGGARVAHLYEWGGFDTDNEWAFDEYREMDDGWDIPIHALLVETGVDIFFHGHDHIYAKETLDGVVYQEVPRPCASAESNDYSLTYLDYDTESPDTALNSGYLRVTIDPSQATVQYVQSDRVNPLNDGVVLHEYTIPADPSDTPPLVQNAAAQTIEEQAVGFALLGTDKEGDPFTFEIVREPLHGTLSGTAPELTYSPDENFFGTDNMVYRATSGTMHGNIAYVSFEVAPVDDPPGLSDMNFDILEDAALAIPLPVSDVDGETLSYSVTEGPSHGTLSGLQTENPVYTPGENYYGADAVTLEISDGHTSETIRINIAIESVNDVPVMEPISAVVTNEDTPVSIVPVVTDGDGEATTVSPTEMPEHGTLSLLENGFVYTPDEDFFGEDRFKSAGFDGTAYSNEVTVSITVVPVDDPPVVFLFSDLLETDEDVPFFINLPGEDPDFDPVSFVIESGPAHGEMSGEGAFWLYTPDDNFNGDDVFTYHIESGGLSSETATVSIRVNPVSDSPQAMDLTLSADVDNTVAIELNASDVDSSELSFEIVRAPSVGELLGEGRDYMYVPPSGYVGEDSFVFRVIDEAGNSDDGEVSIVFRAEGTGTRRDKVVSRSAVRDDNSSVDTSVVEDETDTADTGTVFDEEIPKETDTGKAVEKDDDDGETDIGEAEPVEPSSDTEGDSAPTGNSNAAPRAAASQGCAISYYRTGDMSSSMIEWMLQLLTLPNG